MNAQELGKFVAYKDSVFIMPFIEGRGLPHDFSRYKNHAYYCTAKFRKGFLDTVERNSEVKVANSDSLITQDAVTATILFKFQGKLDISSDNDYRYIFSKDAWRHWHIFVEEYNRLTTSVIVNDENKTRYSTGFNLGHIAQHPMVIFTGLSYDSKTGIIKQYKNYLHPIYKSYPPIELYLGTGDLKISHANATDNRWAFAFIYHAQVWKRRLSDSEVKSSYYHTKRNVKPTCVTRRGVYQAVKNTGIEVDGNMTNIAEVMC